MAEYQKQVSLGVDKSGNEQFRSETARFKSKNSQSGRKGMKGKAAGGRRSRYGRRSMTIAGRLGIMDPMLEKAMMGQTNRG